jgi:hypothetical protein
MSKFKCTIEESKWTNEPAISITQNGYQTTTIPLKSREQLIEVKKDHRIIL